MKKHDSAAEAGMVDLIQDGTSNFNRQLTESTAKNAEIPSTLSTPATVEQPRLRRELFVRGLPPSTTTEKLAEHFSDSYVIRHATVVLEPQTKQSRGYGFVTFADIEDAERALQELDGSLIDGKKIKIEVAQPRHRDIDEDKGKSVPSAEALRLKQERQQQRTQTQPSKLIIRNLPWTIKEADQLAALFRSYGKVKSAVVPKKGSGQAGFGFVIIRGRKNAEKALKGVNGKEVDGRTLAVDWAVDKEVWEAAQQPANHEDTKNEDASETSVVEHIGSDDESIHGASAPEHTSADREQSQDEELSDALESENEEPDKENKRADSHDERNASTLFIRNLPFNSTDESLYEHFKQFGPVHYARIVVDPETERPKGTGFVCFWNLEDAISCARDGPKQTEASRLEDRKAKQRSSGLKHSILQNENIDESGRYTMGDRVLIVTRAVSKTEAAKLTEEGTSRRSAWEKDRRRLFLLSEGTIPSNSALYQNLSPSEIKMREDSLKQRQNLIKNNPMLHLSLTRLSIRNIPRSVTSKDLKALAREGVVGFAKDMKEGLRQPLSQEELQRDTEQLREADKHRREKGKGIVKQAKVIFESRDGAKIEERTGAGRSRGYGFIEYHTHRHALMGLRWLNGHALTSDGENQKKKSLIVEFAIENAQVVKRRNDHQEKMRSLSLTQKPSKNVPEATPQEKTLHPGSRKIGLKRKRSENDETKGRQLKETKREAVDVRTKDNSVAKKNRIIAKKRMQRKMRKPRGS